MTRPQLPWLLLILLSLSYAAIVGRSISPAYIDLGDGNYLYTSSRMADGLMIYRDFLSPQPPLHLLTGSVLIRIGRALAASPSSEPISALYAVRVFSLILHLVTIWLMFFLGRRLCESSWGGLFAAVIYAILPIGFWWSLGYQSELLEIVFLLGALYLFLPLSPGRMAASGALMALAVLTNMTAAPFAFALLVYLIVRHPRRLFLPFFIPFALLVAGTAIFFEWKTGAYLQNVIFNQVGSYPKDNLLSYAWHKLLWQGTKILQLEGAWILAALLGLSFYNRADNRPEREFMVWYAPVLLASVIYVTKGGTADYIFSLAEPMVALFAAYLAIQLGRLTPASLWCRLPACSPETPQVRCSFWKDTSVVPLAFCIIAAIFVASFPGLKFIGDTLHQDQFEQKAEGENSVEHVRYYIDRYSKPGDAIIAPPFYAFITGRRLVGEYSELFLWTLKYSLERAEGQQGEGVRKVREIAAELEAGKVPIVIANISPANLDILKSDEIRQAVEQNYEPLNEQGAKFKTLNFEMQIFVPKIKK